MRRKMKSLLISGALATCIAVVPNGASADYSSYNTTIPPLQYKYIAEGRMHLFQETNNQFILAEGAEYSILLLALAVPLLALGQGMGSVSLV
ncbi:MULTISPECIES: hypothetical protein [Bacillus]|uniref:hypothetical protein n=1 Tax=Bacillus TaxID=1386 RepID=UPI001A01AC22|nr:hypothetical protein [Bacillales bacterium]